MTTSEMPETTTEEIIRKMAYCDIDAKKSDDAYEFAKKEGLRLRDKLIAILEAPVVVPPPPPPTTEILTPTLVQNMILEEGIWKSQPGWQSDIAALHFYKPEIKYGSIVTVTFQRKSSYPWPGNIKVFRVWKDKPGNYPNWYVGHPANSSDLFYVEKLAPVTGVNRFYLTLPPCDGQWHNETWIWKVNSNVEARDGELRIVRDGNPILSKVGVQFDDALYPGVANYIVIQDDPSSQTFPADAYTWVKDINISVS